MKSKESIQKEIFTVAKNVNFINKGRYKYLAHKLDNVIADDEHLKMISAGFYDKRQVDVICTDKRILISDSGISSKIDEIQILQIDSIKTEISFTKSYVEIIVKGREFIINNLVDKQNFVNVVNEQLNQKSNSFNASNIVNNNSNDETDKILKYKNLLDQGIITQEEFDKKKKELLGL
ncbi:MAG: SHOCT domain-containing protein [Clostridia bacterium]|nr:SHOCT domain-containing protein [Clostridia bacterium]